jgi:hypothetical protein
MIKSSRSRVWFFVIIFTFSLAVLVPSSRAQEFVPETGGAMSIKLMGGYAYFFKGIGDVESLRQSMVDYYAALGRASGYTASASWNKLRRMPDFEVEVLFHTSRTIALSLGTGYLVATSKGTYGYAYSESGPTGVGTYSYDQSENVSRDYRFSVLPIKLSLYATFPLGRRFNTYAYVGGGYYFGRLTHNYTEEIQTNFQDNPSSPDILATKQETTVTFKGTETPRQEAFGLHGGLGMELKLGKAVALGVELFGRYVKFIDWEGTGTETATSRERLYEEGQGWYSDTTETDQTGSEGLLKYYEVINTDVGKPYGRLNILYFTPSGENIANVRSASLNMNAYGLMLTFRFFFNWQ